MIQNNKLGWKNKMEMPKAVMIPIYGFRLASHTSHSSHTWVHPGLTGVRVAQHLVFRVGFCRSLFVPLSFFVCPLVCLPFFVWPLDCLPFFVCPLDCLPFFVCPLDCLPFDLRFLITPLIFSNFSYWVASRIIYEWRSCISAINVKTSQHAFEVTYAWLQKL